VPFCASLTSRLISYLAPDMLIYFAQTVLYLNTLQYQIKCKFSKPSNTSLITPTKCAIFIHYIYLLCVCYMFRCYIYHYRRSQYPCGLRRRSTAAPFLRSWVRIPLGAWMFSVVSVVCCQVEVSATD